MVINISWGSISTLGGQLYAEYKTSSGVTYKSGSVAISKSATMNGSGNPQPPADAPNPTKIANTLCCNQTIRLGEKPALITGSQYSNPYKYEPYGINSSWSANGNGSVRFNNLDPATQTLDIDYVTTLGNFAVTRSLGYNSDKTLSNKSNTVTITVVPSPITYNEIHVNGSVNTDGSIEISSTNPKDIIGSVSSINLNILQDPYYVPKRSDTNIIIDKYEWEYIITNGSTEERFWNLIPNQSLASLNSSYLPRSINSKDNFYTIRRIAIYQNVRIASNSLKISLRPLRDNNTICCDQTLEVSSSNEVERPSTLTGTTSISNKNTYLFYQWQSQIVTDQGLQVGNWTNIPQATSQNYTPTKLQFIPGIGRNQPTLPTYNYRRIATDNTYNGEEYYSNEISITPTINISSFALPLLVYPNPAISVINIEDPRIRIPLGQITLADMSINIVNTMGIIVNSNNLSLVNPNLISIDVSNLPVGTYFINLSSSRGRDFSQQFTFIKN